MDKVRRETEDILTERPELASDIETLLEVDATVDHWAFDDVPLDSGVFGELVSRGVVERRGDDYTVTDRAAVRAALDGDTSVTDQRADGRRFGEFDVLTVDRSVVASLLGALGLFVTMRLTTLPSVFVDGSVVLSSNDPYLYLYWVEQLTEQAALLPTDAVSLDASDGEPLFVAVLRLSAAALDGIVSVPGVLAWYPVVAGVTVALLCFRLTTRLTDDWRVGVTTVLLLSVIPEHALRTAVGFADHHAFDYVWTVTVVLAFVELTRASSRDHRWTWVWTAVLGGGIAAQALAWEAGIVLLAPLAVSVFVYTWLGIQDAGFDIAERHLIVGTSLGAVLTLVAHVSLGWQTTFVASVPVLLAVGTAVTFLSARIVRRWDLSSSAFGVIELSVTAVGVGVVFFTVPNAVEIASREVAFLLSPGGIAESRSLFSADTGVIFGPLFSFGTVLFLAGPYLVWATTGLVDDWPRQWVAPVVYGWILFGLTLLQVRFAGEVSLFVSVFSALGFWHLAAVVGVVDNPPEPLSGAGLGKRILTMDGRLDTTAVRNLTVLFLLVSGVNFAVTPGHVGLVTIDSATYQAATGTATYAEANGVKPDEDYVFSDWGRNRVYNYYVSGESRSFGFAQENYGEFLLATNGSTWYERLAEVDRVGFVVTSDEHEALAAPGNLYTVLHERNGSRTTNNRALRHYRLVHVGDNRARKVFELVPGAVVTGVTNESQVTVRKNVSVDGRQFVYRQSVRANDAGVYETRVPYSGEIVADERVSVPESAVRSGSEVSTFPGGGNDWVFEVGRGDTVYDVQNGTHARLRGGTWVDTQEGPAVRFNREAAAVVDGPPAAAGNRFEASIRFRTDPNVDYEDELKYPRLLEATSRGPYRSTVGYQLAMARGRLIAAVGDGSDATVLQGPDIDDGDWHRATLRYNGTHVSLSVDGHHVAVTQWNTSVPRSDRVSIARSFVGTVEAVRTNSTVSSE